MLHSTSEDEVRELAFNVIEIFLLRYPDQLKGRATGVVQIATKYLTYDPNYRDENDHDMDQSGDADGDGDGSDADMDEASDDNEYSDEYSDDDDDDISWKVRRASVKILAALILTRPDASEKIVASLMPRVIKAVRDRDASVGMQALQALTSIFNRFKLICQRTGRDIPNLASVSLSNEIAYMMRPVPVVLETDSAKAHAALIDF